MFGEILSWFCLWYNDSLYICV